jgi:Ca2+:H+ antiporter
MSQAFAGLVVVAIAGNAVENVVGIQLASLFQTLRGVEVLKDAKVPVL